MLGYSIAYLSMTHYSQRATNTILTIFVVATSIMRLIQGFQHRRLPAACVRMYTENGTSGQWLDMCESNPSLPLAFAEQVQYVCVSKKKYKRRKERVLFFHFHEYTNYRNPRGRSRDFVLFANSCRSLTTSDPPFIIRSAERCEMDRYARNKKCFTRRRKKHRRRMTRPGMEAILERRQSTRVNYVREFEVQIGTKRT